MHINQVDPLSNEIDPSYLLNGIDSPLRSLRLEDGGFFEDGDCFSLGFGMKRSTSTSSGTSSSITGVQPDSSMSESISFVSGVPGDIP